MTKEISVCVPCTKSHVNLLDRCLASIANQILRPKEVVISISSVLNMGDTQKQVEEIIAKHKELNVIVLYTLEKQYAGENRNKAVEAASGDIVSFIDADDTMYSNRLYVLSRAFNDDPDCVGILHYFTENAEERSESWKYDPDSIKKYQYTPKLHFGHFSARRSLFKEYQYGLDPRMQDIKFIEVLLPKYINNLRVCTKKLSNYHSNDSTLYNPAYR